jgi:hypothetical protein
MAEASFDRVISEHLALCERNRRLERRMPLDAYREHVGGESTTRVSPDASSGGEPQTETGANDKEEHWLDSESFWDTSGQRPLPEFDWGDD